MCPSDAGLEYDEVVSLFSRHQSRLTKSREVSDHGFHAPQSLIPVDHNSSAINVFILPSHVCFHFSPNFSI
ncbi:hypothetical protein QVD17_36114 [Tagetes erecta]|uniref:Uncharacterized protein n=1 Tax=Tagetes erecta TaxID=13708 RepID=A0AAD8JVP7_TARER|nr:hypothetical protein QVD17_36114 [Tagetes erecta]